MSGDVYVVLGLSIILNVSGDVYVVLGLLIILNVSGDIYVVLGLSIILLFYHFTIRFWNCLEKKLCFCLFLFLSVLFQRLLKIILDENKYKSRN